MYVYVIMGSTGPSVSLSLSIRDPRERGGDGLGE